MTNEELQRVKRGVLLRVNQSPFFDDRFRTALARAGHVVQALNDNNLPYEVLVHIAHWGHIALRMENLELHDPPRYADAGWSPYA